jgi:hypothetical protein
LFSFLGTIDFAAPEGRPGSGSNTYLASIEEIILVIPGKKKK